MSVRAACSTAPATRSSADVPQLAVPRSIVDRLDVDPDAGVDLAVELVTEVQCSKAFDGVHLIPVNRYRQVAAALEAQSL